MGLDFSRTQPQTGQITLELAGGESMTVGADKESVPDEGYDIAADRRRMNETLTGSDEVDRLVSTVELDNLATIATFGAEAAKEISRASDVILNSVSLSQSDDTDELLNELAAIMGKFDIGEIRDNPGFFDKLFGNMKRQLERIMEKYHTMGDEVDKIYVRLRQYEEQIKQSNRSLKQLFDANVNYYHELVKYILAGEQACREIEKYISIREADMERTGDKSIQFELTTLKQAYTMMEQRTQDLRTAEVVAMQSIPMIKMMEFSNYNLVRKINSAFIVTLPVFKQALAQAILLKRQRIQAESIAALDKKTNEMLARNARDTAKMAKGTAAIASGTGGRPQTETLETAWQTILDGIDETKQLQKDARQRQREERLRLEEIKKSFSMS